MCREKASLPCTLHSDTKSNTSSDFQNFKIESMQSISRFGNLAVHVQVLLKEFRSVPTSMPKHFLNFYSETMGLNNLT